MEVTMVLTNSQYEQLMSRYYERQLRTKHIARAREQEVYAAVPEFAALDRRIGQSSIDYARERLSHSGTADEEQNLPQQIQRISEEKEELLVRHGFPPDYLQPVYICPDCQDTGYIGDRKCHCFERAIVDFLYSQSNLQDILER